MWTHRYPQATHDWQAVYCGGQEHDQVKEIKEGNKAGKYLQWIENNLSICGLFKFLKKFTRLNTPYARLITV